MEMKIPRKLGLTGYISDTGYICLAQDGSEGQLANTISIPQEDVEIVVGWLNKLLEKRKNTPDENYESKEDDEESDIPY